MASELIVLAGAITAQINATLGGTNAVSAYAPVVTLDDLPEAYDNDELPIYVSPASETSQAISRESLQTDRVIVVEGIAKLNPGVGLSAVDGSQIAILLHAMDLIEESLRFGYVEAAGFSFAWVAASRDPYLDREAIEQRREFRSVLTVTYRSREYAT